MIPPFSQVIGTSVYPAMSHPSADPARNFVAARLAGFEAKDPSRAKILEIGCASGHHLVPLAKRWPESQFVGIDSDRNSIAQARESAAVADLKNVVFHHASITDFEAEAAEFDYIIAHGFFSWVPDETKSILMDFIQSSLASQGLAVVSFNVAAAWRKRLPVILKARAIMEAGGVDGIAALHVLRDVTADADESCIINDMIAKGAEVLPFDDFAPTNDAWTVSDFIAFSAQRGLRWIGASEPGTSSAISAELLDAWDEERACHFRSELICRDDAPISEKIPTNLVLQFAAHLADPLPPLDHDAAAIAKYIAARAPSVVPLIDLIEDVPDMDIRKIVAVFYRGIIEGWLVPRSEALRLYEIAPSFPLLDPWHRWCLEKNYPLVDALHRPCTFSKMQQKLLSLMDGNRGLEELAALAKVHTPQLDFWKWIAHVAGRGLFCQTA